MSDQTQTTVRVGLLGCGRLAEFGYLPAFDLATGVALAGVADVNRNRCRQLAPAIPAYDDMETLISAGGLDGLVIATPTRCHLADATRAAAAGLPVLLEKPPGQNLAEARALLQLEPRPWLAFNRRHDPELLKLKSRLPDGDALNLHLELHYRRTGWKPFDMHDDALLDLGPHLIDLGRWLSGSEIQSVQTVLLKRQRAEFTLSLSRARVTAICSCDHPYRESVRAATGSGGEVARFERGGIVAGILARLRRTASNPLVASLVGQLEAFGLAVRGIQPAQSLPSVDDGIAVMTAIEALRRSAQQAGKLCPVAPC